MKIIKYLLIITLMACGCERNQKKAGRLTVADVSRTLVDLKPDDCIVIVNGTSLTKKQHTRMLNNWERIYKVKNRDVSVAVLEAMRRRRSRQLVSEFVTRRLLLDQAETMKISPAAEQRQQAELIFRQRAKAEGLPSIQMLAEAMGDTPDEFNQRIEERAVIKALLKKEFGTKLEVSAEELQKARENVEAYNQRCNATNELVMARGEMIVQKINEGIDFELMAIEYSEDRGIEEATEWGEFSRLEIEDANIRNAAFTEPVGSVAGPFDTDEGLVIIKILSRTDVGAAEHTQPIVKLARIFLRMGEEAEFSSDKEIIAEVKLNKKKKFLAPYIQTLKEKANIEYPNGINLWGKSSGLFDQVIQNSFEQ